MKPRPTGQFRINLTMYCPKCGKPDQVAEAYCRNCGLFLPDLSKPLAKVTKPDEHVTANLVLGIMTVITSFTLAVLVYVYILSLTNVPFVAYPIFGLLLAMGAWHVQTVWRSILLRKHFKKNEENQKKLDLPGQTSVQDLRVGTANGQLFHQEPQSVIDNTTRELVERKRNLA